MALVAVTNLFVMYFLALRTYALIAVAALSGAGIVLFVALWHDTVAHIIWAFMSGICIALALLCALYLRR
jgi:hypothetical protein